MHFYKLLQTVITFLIYLYLISLPQVVSREIHSLPKISDLSTNFDNPHDCDMLIFLEGATNENFEPDLTTIITLFHLSTYVNISYPGWKPDQSDKLYTKMSHSSPCKFHILILNENHYEQNSESSLVWLFDQFLSDGQHQLLHYSSSTNYWIRRKVNVYPILMTNMNKSEVTSFLVWISTEISIVSGRKLAIFSNFGNKYNFCISSRHANSLGFLLCKRGLNHGYTEGIVSLFQELSTPPKWKFMVLDEHSILIDDLYKVSAAASNPFITSVPINYHLIQILLYKENVSYAREEDPYATASWKPVEVAAYDSSPLIVTYLGWKFLTCYSNTYLSFSFYTAPFQVEVWCGIFVTVATLILVLVLFQKYDDSDDTSYLSPWLFILANMLEESGSIPRSMEKKAFYRYTLGSWVLMSVILTNCYNGLMITSLNAPLPGWGPTIFQD